MNASSRRGVDGLARSPIAHVIVALAVAFLGGCAAHDAARVGETSDAGAEDGGERDTGVTSDAAVVEETGTPVATTTRTALLANNTAASVAFTDSYTPAARFDGSTTPVSNGDAPPGSTLSADLSVGAVSKLPIRSLMYPGATTQVFVETQGWFCTNGVTPLPTGLNVDQCGSHIDIGYGSNYAAQANLQVADMMSRGIDGAIMDWTGQGAGDGIVDQKSTDASAINTGRMFLFKAAAEASDGKFRFAAVEDEGIKACAATQGCDVTTQLTSDIAFLDANFFGSPAYLTQGGRPVLFFFSEDAWVQPYGKTIDWTTVRANAAGNPLFMFENAGGFGHSENDGAYSWVDVTPIASYPGSDPFGTQAFLPYFYGQAMSHDDAITWGSAYKGFDDEVVNGWGGGRRYVGQQCGKTWLDTLALPGTYYSAQNQLDGIQLVTWDDYEEGSELETGIDNHVAVTASVTGGSTVAWTIALDATAPTECAEAITGGFALATTLDHFSVYASGSTDGEDLALVVDSIPASARTLDLTGKLPAGHYLLYVYAVGKASIHNHLSSGVAYGAP